MCAANKKLQEDLVRMREAYDILEQKQQERLAMKHNLDEQNAVKME